MKKLRRCVLLVSLLLLPMIQVYASNCYVDKIFPTPLGALGSIQGNNINVRSYPNIYAQVTASVDAKNVRVLGQNEEWYKVTINNKEGWIYKKYVQVDCERDIPYSKIKGEEIVEYGKQFIGTPYVWGGNDLKKGVDCSGLTQEVFKTFDINLSRVSYMQVKDGKQIGKAQLMPGDLVFFDTSGSNNGNISHVGIYAGHNKFLHADGTKGVMLSNLNSPYYRRNYVTSARIL